jgi:quercetin dioxygenase-like cupin family protein
MKTQEWIEKLESEGYSNVDVCVNAAYLDFGEHTHEEHTVHVILQGELMVTTDSQSEIFNEGKRVEFPVGTKHHAKAGPEGCTFVVGTKS